MRSEVGTVQWGGLDDHGSDRFERLLSRDERDRAASFRFLRDRSRYVVARGLLRTVLGERLGLDPARIEFAYGERGEPCLPDHTGLHFNLSHSAGMMALAISEERRGRDRCRGGPEDLFAEGIARRYLPAQVATEIEGRPRPTGRGSSSAPGCARRRMQRAAARASSW